MNNLVRKVREKADNRLRLWCSRLSPKNSLVLVIGMLAVFAVLSIYMAVSSIYFAQRPDLNIQYIEGLKLPKSSNDSINFLKIKEYDEFDE